MASLITTLHTARQASVIPGGRAGLIGLWVLQVAVAALITMAGITKLSGNPDMIAVFDQIGIGRWFLYVTGAIEVVAGVALLIPLLAPFGALLLIPTMIGAVATHLFIVGGSPMVAFVLLIASSVIVWVRRNQLRRAYKLVVTGA